MRDIILLIRPWHWIKNLFIFLPLFFALQLYHFPVLAKAGLAFIFFCLLASSVYIFNDYIDRDLDKLNPWKKMRPLASGRVSVPKALIFSAAMLAIGLIGTWLFCIKMFYLALLYLVLNILYTIKLKHVVIIDVVIIAVGFVIRIFIGGVVTEIIISPWIVVMTFLLTIFLAMGKRREHVLLFLKDDDKFQKSIDGYNLTFIDSCMIILAAIIIASYITYTLSIEIAARYKTDNLYLTAFFVIPGIMRYLQIVMVKRNYSDPTGILISDHFIQLCVFGWIAAFFLLIYI